MRTYSEMWMVWMNVLEYNDLAYLNKIEKYIQNISMLIINKWSMIALSRAKQRKKIFSSWEVT